MIAAAVTVAAALTIAGAEISPAVVHAPDSPVRLSRAKVLNVAVAPNEPAVLLYEATNPTDQDLEHFTVIAFIFDAQGTLKAKQVAPARHMLEKGTTKFSTLVLDGHPVEATDRIVVGVNQAQRVGSAKWWNAELDAAAKEAVKGK